MTTIPSGYKDLLEKKAFASLATVNADGTPQVTPVWFEVRVTFAIALDRVQVMG